MDGEYFFDLNPGEYILNFRFIGYKSVKKKVVIEIQRTIRYSIIGILFTSARGQY